MRISQLAAAADIPVATVKYYLRDGLLHEGRRTSATQATYDDSHLRRLQLIRALTGPAGLTLAATRKVLAVLEDPPPVASDLLAAAHIAVAPPPAEPTDNTRALALLERWGWGSSCHHDATVSALSRAVHGLEDAGFDPGDETLDEYARSMLEVAEREIAGTPLDSAEDATRYVLLGTVLIEPLLLALRRLAQGHASELRFGAATTSTGPAMGTKEHRAGSG